MLPIFAAMPEDPVEQLRFEDIYRNYRRQMLMVAQRVLRDSHDAEDAVQNALMGIAKHIHKVPAGNEKILRAYVLTAAKNAALSMLPAKQQRDDTVDISELTVAAEDDLFRQVAASQDYEGLLRAMRQLDPKYREVLMLVYVQEQSVRDAADILHRREGTVRQQLNRGRKLLIELCRKEGMLDVQKTTDAL